MSLHQMLLVSQVGSHQSHLPYEDDRIHLSQGEARLWQKRDENGAESGEKSEKKEQKEYEQKIIKLRAKELNSKFELKEGKGEVQVLLLKGKTVGEYINPGLIGPTLNNFRHNLFDLEQIQRLVEKATPAKSLNLYKGFSNWCACGAIDLNSRDFMGHCMDHHRGSAMKNCQLNRPPWADWMNYEDDEVIELICFTDENLDNYFNNN